LPENDIELNMAMPPTADTRTWETSWWGNPPAADKAPPYIFCVVPSADSASSPQANSLLRPKRWGYAGQALRRDALAQGRPFDKLTSTGSVQAG